MTYYYLPYEQLLNGSFFGSIFNVYDTSFGGGGLFYLIAYLAILVFISLATESPAPTGVFTILGGIVFIPLMAGVYQQISYVIAVLFVAVTLYKVLIYKRGAKI